MKHFRTLVVAALASAALMSTAYAADLIVEEPIAEVGVVDVGNWDGPFIGVFGGFGWGDADHVPLIVSPGNDIELSGWLLGVDAGFNATVSDGIVVGVVGDIAWSNIEGTITGADIVIGPFTSITHNIDWLASLRGRVGFDGGAFMPYLTAGLAVAHATRDTVGPVNSNDATHVGWTVGAGVEFMVTEDVSIDLLYRYSDYGEELYAVAPATVPNVALTTHTIQAGLHWNF